MITSFSISGTKLLLFFELCKDFVKKSTFYAFLKNKGVGFSFFYYAGYYLASFVFCPA